MTLGFESNLPTPLVSAALMNRSTAKLGDRWPKKTPLVGTAAPRFTLKGKLGPDPAADPPPPISGGAGRPVPVDTGLTPTRESPPITVRPPVVEPANPHCTPMSWEKVRFA